MPNPRAKTVYTLRNRSGPVRISHHEMLDSVALPQAMTAYTIQPSSVDTFTWLPAIASRYEQYRLEKLTVNYVPSAAKLTPGTVYLAIDLDCLDSPPSGGWDMSQFKTSSSGAPYDPQSISLTAKDANRVPWHYTAHEGYPVMCDRKTYDIGTLYVFCEGDAVANIGRLYIEYTFTFTQPTIEVAPITTIAIAPVAGGSESPYSPGTAPTITALSGGLLLEDMSTGSRTYDDSGGVARTGVIRSYKVLRDFEGLISWAGQYGPHWSGGNTDYSKLLPVVSNALAGPYQHVENLENSYHASIAHSAVDQGTIQGGSILTKLKKWQFIAFPQHLVAGTATNTDGSEPFLVTMAQMIIGGLTSSVLSSSLSAARLAIAAETGTQPADETSSSKGESTAGGVCPKGEPYEIKSSGFKQLAGLEELSVGSIEALLRKLQDSVDRLRNADSPSVPPPANVSK